MKIAVVKIGSSVIAPRGNLDTGLVAKIVKDILDVQARGFKVVLVSSGAIACGLNVLGHKRKPQDIHSLMAISSLGQVILMDVFNAKFKKYGTMCAQILLTWDDFDNRTRFMNVRKTIDRLFAMGVVPIINENDAVSYEEIRLGDNDCISARVADLVGASHLIILSDVEGLFDKDVLVREVRQVDAKIRALVCKKDTTHTSGGMNTKLEAARIAALAGIPTVIAHGRTTRAVSRILSGEAVGTLFVSCQKKHGARKRWIIFSKKTKGTVTIDEGAVQALLFKGKSLLGVGITKSEGDFKKGDAVRVLNQEGKVIGHGIVNYDASEFIKIKEKRFEKEAIHRDNFVGITEETGGEE